jgi:peroxiredoxin
MLRAGRLLLLTGAVAALLFALSPPAGAEPGNEPRAPSTTSLVGSSAPEISVTRVSGSSPLSMAQLRGRVVVLDFWATWCAPCHQVMRVLDGLSRTHEGAGLTVLGISNEPRQLVEAFGSRGHVGYTLASDGAGTMRRYGVRYIPTLVIIDRSGNVREVLHGTVGAASLDNQLRSLLAEPAP